MTNVVEFRTHRKHQQEVAHAADRAAVVADLTALSAGIREAVEKTVDLTGPSLHQLERTIQHLVDALHQLENATIVLTQDHEWEPF